MRPYVSWIGLAVFVALAAGSDAVLGPSFEVVGTSVDASCSRLTDYCVRATCVVRNTGPGDGVATVRFVAEAESFNRTADVQVAVPSGAEGTATYDFTEAKLLDDTRVRCELAP